MLVHLSQIFSNPSFEPRLDKFTKAMRDIFVHRNPKLSEQTWSVFISVLFCGTIELGSRDPDVQLGQLAVDALFLGQVYSPTFFSQFQPQLKKLFQSVPATRTVWLNKFDRVYQRLLRARYLPVEKAESQRDVYQAFATFLRHEIDDEFDAPSKQRAFGVAIQCWLTILSARDHKSLVQQPWPTDEIKGLFLRWFSIDGGWNRRDFLWLGEMIWHPIFLLLKMGAPESNPTLCELATQIVTKTLGLDQNWDTDVYWYLPIYAYDFLLVKPELLALVQPQLVLFFERARETSTPQACSRTQCFC
jgi:hypothetical protein